MSFLDFLFLSFSSDNWLLILSSWPRDLSLKSTSLPCYKTVQILSSWTFQIKMHFATLSILQFLFPALLTKSSFFSFVFQKQYWAKDSNTITDCPQSNRREECVLPFSTLLMTWVFWLTYIFPQSLLIKITVSLDHSSYLEKLTFKFLIYRTLEGSLKTVISLQGQSWWLSTFVSYLLL